MVLVVVCVAIDATTIAGRYWTTITSFICRLKIATAKIMLLRNTLLMDYSEFITFEILY